MSLGKIKTIFKRKNVQALGAIPPTHFVTFHFALFTFQNLQNAKFFHPTYKLSRLYKCGQILKMLLPLFILFSYYKTDVIIYHFVV